jgi:hypothetical protein
MNVALRQVFDYALIAAGHASNIFGWVDSVLLEGAIEHQFCHSVACVARGTSHADGIGRAVETVE